MSATDRENAAPDMISNQQLEDSQMNNIDAVGDSPKILQQICFEESAYLWKLVH